MNNNEIPKNVRDKIDNAYDEILKNNINKQNKKKPHLKVASIIITCMTMVGFGIYNPSLAKGIPVIHDIFEKINYSLINNEDFKNNLDSINASSYNNGLTITIEDVIYDSNKMYMNMVFKTDEVFNESEYFESLFLYEKDTYGLDAYFEEFIVNDKKIENSVSGLDNIEIVDENTIKANAILDLEIINEVKGEYIDFNTTVKMNAINEDFVTTKTLDGEWNFDFKINTNKDDTEVIKVNETKGDFTINEILISPMTITIDVIANNNFFDEEYDIMEAIELTTNNGSPNWPTTSEYKEYNSNTHKRYQVRYDLKNIGEDIDNINIYFYGIDNDEEVILLEEFNIN